jgi:hypothetical protein
MTVETTEPWLAVAMSSGISDYITFNTWDTVGNTVELGSDTDFCARSSTLVLGGTYDAIIRCPIAPYILYQNAVVARGSQQSCQAFGFYQGLQSEVFRKVNVESVSITWVPRVPTTVTGSVMFAYDPDLVPTMSQITGGTPGIERFMQSQPSTIGTTIYQPYTFKVPLSDKLERYTAGWDVATGSSASDAQYEWRQLAKGCVFMNFSYNALADADLRTLGDLFVTTKCTYSHFCSPFVYSSLSLTGKEEKTEKKEKTEPVVTTSSNVKDEEGWLTLKKSQETSVKVKENPSLPRR